MKLILTYVIALMVFCSCGKTDVGLTPEEKQKQQEQQEPLKSNELLEQEGLRFCVLSPVTDTAIIQVSVNLYKGSGATKSSEPLAISKDGNMNYSILSNQMDNNSEYTLTIDYIKVLQTAPFDLHTEGFTSISGNKEFLIDGRSFLPANSGTSKDLMLIKKGILKFSLFELTP